MQIRGPWLASLALFVVLVVGKWLFGSTDEADAAAFNERYPTKDSCLSFAAERLAQCTSPGCEQLVGQRMQQCFDQADGDKELFCENISRSLADSAGRDIFAAHCEPYSPYESECQKVVGYAGLYCSRLI